MRLFIACPLGERAAAFLEGAQKSLGGMAVRARLTPGEQMHLTLRFIGEADGDMTGRLRAWFRALPALPREALMCGHAGYGFFHGRDGLLAYAALRCAPALAEFTARLERDLRGMGLAPETKPWKAHVTLARNAAFRGSPEDAAAALPRMEAPLSLLPPALFLSEFLPGGVRHTPLERIGN